MLNSTRARRAWGLIRELKTVLIGGVLIMLLGRAMSMVLPACSRWLVDDVIVHGQLRLLPRYMAIIVGSSLVGAASSFALTEILARAAQEMIARLRIRVQEHLGKMPVSFYDRTPAGTLVASLMHEVEDVRSLVDTGIADFAGRLVTAIFALALMIANAPLPTLIAVVTFGAALIFSSRVMLSIRHLFERRREQVANLSSRYVESVGGIRVIKSYCAEEQESQTFRGHVLKLLDSIVVILRKNALINAGTALGVGGLSAMLIWICAREIVAGRMTLGQSTSFAAFLALFVSPLSTLGSVWTSVSTGIVGASRITDILEMSTEHDDARRSRVLHTIRGDITFEAVSFRYHESGPFVLTDASLEARCGSTTALVGPSGAGKSTVAALVAAFYAATKGRILVDDVDLSTVELRSYRRHLGVVLQEPFLFNGTILENVALARRDASSAQIIEACRRAQVDEFAEALAQQYDTPVGERGVLLSGGQRQRIAIARAFLADPAILILDEPTANLDVQAEALVQRALRELVRARTTIVIAHRLSTVRDADQIFYLDNGRILERGDHTALISAKGRYHETFMHALALAGNGELPVLPPAIQR